MITDGRDPSQWKRAGVEPSATLGRLRDLVRAMGEPPELTDKQLTRIAAELRPPSRRRHRLRVWMALVGAVLFGSSAVLAARLGWVPNVRRWLSSQAPSETLPSPAAPRRAPKGTVAPGPLPAVAPAPPPVDEVTPPSPGEEVIPHLAPPRGQKLHAARDPMRVGEVATPSTAAADSQSIARLEPSKTAPLPRADATGPVPMAPSVNHASVAHESPRAQAVPHANRSPQTVDPLDGSRWLADAIRQLRHEKAPATTLALLDRHAGALTAAGLDKEALLVRIEALLALHRSDEVLRLLDEQPLAQMPASRGLLLTRGELRAAADRCGEGLADFELVLARARKPDERALYGRAVCRHRLGDAAGARVDLETYRREFSESPRRRELEQRLLDRPDRR